jgi:long-subunit fatty acid transport protein
MSAMGKVSFGNMRQQVDIRGSNTVSAGGFDVTTPGGLLAQPTNIGSYEQDRYVWLPEANVRLSYAFNKHLSASVGCTFLYWTSVALAGDQVDLRVNATQLTGGNLAGPATPQFRWSDTDFWVQTLDLGLSWNY